MVLYPELEQVQSRRCGARGGTCHGRVSWRRRMVHEGARVMDVSAGAEEWCQ
jgi:hypothetical protein